MVVINIGNNNPKSIIFFAKSIPSDLSSDQSALIKNTKKNKKDDIASLDSNIF